MITRAKAGKLRADVAVQTARSSGGSIWQEALLPYIISRVALFVVGLLAALYILPLLKSNSVLPSIANTHFPDAIWLMWNRFDGGFYIDIARHGYWTAETLQASSNWIFLPLYPLLIYPLGHLWGGSIAAFDIAGIIIANAAGLVAVIYLYRLVRREFHARIAYRTVIYLILFPTSFYLSATYPESLFLVCALACIYYAREKRWWLAGLCGALASLARIQGFLLVFPIA
ncbi:MAG: glycosyltransferase family 39 protein, partial [Ktedonobacteraceae bacterium]|nr:glycosyltransferase family 39 protein [Ktedonobacteraceae bacterium]